MNQTDCFLTAVIAVKAEILRYFGQHACDFEIECTYTYRADR